MAGARFSDGQWQRIWAYLEDHPGIYVGQETPTRLFLDAVLWMARAGAPWRLLPAGFGPWNSVYKRFARRLNGLGQEKGVWQMLMDRLSTDGRPRVADARQHRGARSCLRCRGKKSEGEQCLGRSRGGFSSKLHGASWGAGSPQSRMANSLGNPLRFALTAGQAGDAPEAIPLLTTVAMIAVQAVLADRAYDSDAILAWIAERNAVAVIPPNPSRATTRETDWCHYKQRAGTECLFGKMKHFRRVFSRFDKLARRYLAFVHLVAVCILLR